MVQWCLVASGQCAGEVNHYAGEVIYTVDGWVPKSIDGLSKHLSDVLRSSTESQVKELFEQEEAAPGRGREPL